MDKAVVRYQQQQQQPAILGEGGSHVMALPGGSGNGIFSLEGGTTSAGGSGAAGGSSEHGAGGEWDDSRSEMSGISLAPSSVFSHLRASGAAHLQPSLLQQQRRTSHGGEPGPPTTSAAAPSAASSMMRLGFKLEARGDVRRLVDVLEQRLASAGRDLSAARSEVGALTEANRMMGQRVAELEGGGQWVLPGEGGAGGRGQRELALERELEEVSSAQPSLTNLQVNKPSTCEHYV